MRTELNEGLIHMLFVLGCTKPITIKLADVDLLYLHNVVFVCICIWYIIQYLSRDLHYEREDRANDVRPIIQLELDIAGICIYISLQTKEMYNFN